MKIKGILQNIYMNVYYSIKRHTTRFIEIEYLYNGCLPRSHSPVGMMKLFELAKQSKRSIVELGNWCGNATVILAEGSARGHKQIIHTIDDHKPFLTNQGYNFLDSDKMFKHNLQKTHYHQLVHPISKKSNEVVKDWTKVIGLLFIDTPTDPCQQFNDCLDWMGFVDNETGVIVSRDFLDIDGLKLVWSFSSFFVYRKVGKENLQSVGFVAELMKAQLEWGQ